MRVQLVASAFFLLCLSLQHDNRLDSVELNGHTDPIMGLSFSPDGTLLASCSRDGTIRLWSVSERKVLSVLMAREWWATGVRFSANGRTLAGSYADGAIYLWDVITRREPARRLAGHTDQVVDLSFSPDGRTLASGGDDGTVRLWDVATGRVRHVLAKHTDEVESVVFSHDGATLATTALDSTVRLWDVASGEQRFVLDAGPVVVIAFSQNDALVASAGNEKVIRLWDVRSGKRTAILKSHSERLSCLVFSQDQKYLISSGYETLDAWNLGTLREESTSQIPMVIYSGCLAPSRDGHLVGALANGNVAWWKNTPPLTKPEWQTNLKHGRIVALDVAQQQELLAAGCWDGCVILVRWQKGGAVSASPVRKR